MSEQTVKLYGRLLGRLELPPGVTLECMPGSSVGPAVDQDADALTSEQQELLDGATRDACALTGQDISPEAVRLAAEVANAVELETGIKSKVPHATLFHICEIAVRLEGQPAVEIAGAMVSLTLKLLETHAKPARQKLPKWKR